MRQGKRLKVQGVKKKWREKAGSLVERYLRWKKE